MRNFGDISYPRSSAKPTAKTGDADNINQFNSSAFKSNTTAKGQKPNDSKGINPSKLLYIARPPTLGIKPLCALWIVVSSRVQTGEKTRNHSTK